jgi:probable rRNA maturation factor
MAAAIPANSLREMILNRQRRVPVSLGPLENFLARVQRRLNVPKDAVTVCLVTGPAIARWNKAYRGKHRPTDVLSFSSNGISRKRNQSIAKTQRSRVAPSPARGRRHPSSVPWVFWYLGDIAICPLVARRNATRFGRTLGEELRILILHGVLHLLGYDHEVDNGAMERREQRLRREFGLH